VYKTELDEATGASKKFSSPEDALAWQAAQAGKSTTINVYQSDGRSVIGVFVIQPAESGPAT
jgi:hypothetical protein